MTSYAEMKRAWQRKWALMRQDYLDGKLLDAAIVMIEAGVVRWECPICGKVGLPQYSAGRALTAGRGHMQTHVTPKDRQVLEEMKILNMPEELMTPFQRVRYAILTNQVDWS